MIIEEIKNSIRDAIFAVEKDITFHFENASHTEFPFCALAVKNYKIEPALFNQKQKQEFSLELVYQKSDDNEISELIDFQKKLQNALLPTIKVQDAKLTVDNPVFNIANKQLVMNFDLFFWTFEEDNDEKMKTLDITFKGGNNAR